MKSKFGLPKIQAFTFIGLLMIIAVIAILAAMLLPALARSKSRAQRINCANNLKQVALAFRVWALDNGDSYPMGVPTNKHGTAEWVEGGNAFRHFQALSSELGTPKILACPSDVRQAAADFKRLKNENVSYFVGLDAKDTLPQMFLSGDRNITNGLAPKRSILELSPKQPAGWTEAMHGGQGNIGLADGSVQQFTTMRLRDAIRNTGDSTNRVALPE